MVEQLICNQQVGGSSPSTSSISLIKYGRFPEWPKGTDCKSVVYDFGGSNPPPPTKKKQIPFRYLFLFACGGFESRLLTKRRWRFVTGVAFPQESESTTSQHFTYTAVPFFVIPQTLHHTTACHQPRLSHREANTPPPSTSPILPFFLGNPLDLASRRRPSPATTFPQGSESIISRHFIPTAPLFPLTLHYYVFHHSPITKNRRRSLSPASVCYYQTVSYTHLTLPTKRIV